MKLAVAVICSSLPFGCQNDSKLDSRRAAATSKAA